MQCTFFFFFFFFLNATGDGLTAELKGDRRGGECSWEEPGPQRRSLLVVFLSLFVEQEPSVLALLACYRLSGQKGEEGWTCPLAWLLSGWAGLLSWESDSDKTGGQQDP